MPNTFSAATRATDDDRVQICRTLDEALADGQLTGAEHESRVSTAMHAKTVRELRALVRDLQSENPLPVTRGAVAPGTTAFRLVVPAIATVLVLILLIALAGRIGGNGDPDPAEPAAAKDELLTVAGFSELLDVIRTQIGTTEVDDLTVYTDYAVIYVPDPQAPLLKLSYYYDGELDTPTAGGTRSNEGTVNIDSIDVPRLAGVVLGIDQSLNMSAVDQVYAIVRNLDGTPEVLIHANNERGESGHLSMTPAGEFIYTYPFEPGK